MGAGTAEQVHILASRPLGRYTAQPWTDVDPTRRRLDPESAPAVVAGLPSAAAAPASDADWHLISLCLETVTSALVERYGLWAVGWCWSIGEGNLGGGVVGEWCRPRHSITTPEATAAPMPPSEGQRSLTQPGRGALTLILRAGDHLYRVPIMPYIAGRTARHR
jgi:hypothetical protein